MLGKIHLGFTFAAIAFFFLPWLELRCSGEKERYATQTGLQAIYGGTSTHGSPSQERRKDARQHQDSVGFSPLLAVALLATLGAFALSLASFRAGAATPSKTSNALCGLALGLILLEMATGFPVEARIKQDSDAKAGEAWTVHYRPALYLELACLAFPTLLLLGGGLDKLKTKPDQAT